MVVDSLQGFPVVRVVVDFVYPIDQKDTKVVVNDMVEKTLMLTLVAELAIYDIKQKSNGTQ